MIQLRRRDFEGRSAWTPTYSTVLNLLVSSVFRAVWSELGDPANSFRHWLLHFVTLSLLRPRRVFDVSSDHEYWAWAIVNFRRRWTFPEARAA